MTLVLAPYNDSMRLGQGFNSYTHELCIDKAVLVKPGARTVSSNQSQVVSYSSREISKLSDVVDSLNISFSSAIKKGTVEISGSSSTIDETTFKESDLNIMVSVKVTNQTTSLDDDLQFQKIAGLFPGTSEFNETYGDSFISGFIEGGDFTGIISMKALRREESSIKVAQLKNALSSADKQTEMLFDSFDGNASKTSRAMEGMECTISVSWRGGGDVKNETELWSIDSLHAAAAAFPAKVAQVPQRTWAILTKYKANRSFVQTFSDIKLYQTLQYDQVAAFTAELFDSFMDYKLLLKYIQDVISNKDCYEQKIIVNSIDTSMNTLLSVKSALRNEQSKIVHAIGILSRDPGILQRQGAHVQLRSSPVVSSIMNTVLGERVQKQQSAPSLPKASKIAESAPRAASSSSDDFVNVQNDSKMTTSVPAPVMEDDFDFGAMIPPEVWLDVMPQLKKVSVVSQIPQIGLSDGPPPIPAPGSLEKTSLSQVILSQSLEGLRRDLDAQKEATQAAETLAKRAQALVVETQNRYNDLNAESSQKLENANKLEQQLRNDIAEKEQRLRQASIDLIDTVTKAKQASDKALSETTSAAKEKLDKALEDAKKISDATEKGLRNQLEEARKAIEEANKATEAAKKAAVAIEENWKTSQKTLGEAQEKVKSLEATSAAYKSAKEQAERDRDINLNNYNIERLEKDGLKRDMVPSPGAAWCGSRIQIYHIFVGTAPLTDSNIDMVKRAIQFAESQTVFKFCVEFGGPFPFLYPAPGAQGIILYRYDNTGPMRCLATAASSASPIKFDPLPERK